MNGPVPGRKKGSPRWMAGRKQRTEMVWCSSGREDELGPSAGQQRQIPQAKCIKTLQYTTDKMDHRRLTDSQTCLTGWRSGVRRDRVSIWSDNESQKDQAGLMDEVSKSQVLFLVQLSLIRSSRFDS